MSRAVAILVVLLLATTAAAGMPPPFPFRTFSPDEVRNDADVMIGNDFVPMYSYGNADERHMSSAAPKIGGPQYSPELIAEYAIGLYAHAGEAMSAHEAAADRAVLLAQANWLVENATLLTSPNGTHFAVWKFRSPNKTYGANTEWISAAAQGLGIAALVEAHALTKDARYLSTARQALGAFAIPTKDGGVRTEFSDGDAWYEDVAAPDAPSSRILVGFLHALGALDYYWRYTKDAEALRLRDEGLSALQHHIHEYDAGWMSLFDKGGRIAYAANSRQAAQLIWFGRVLPSKTLLDYGRRFAAYSRSTDFRATATTTVPGYEPSLLESWTPNRAPYYSSGLLPIDLVLTLNGCRVVYGAWMQGRSAESLPVEYTVQISDDNVAWRPVVLDAARSVRTVLQNNEPVLLTVFEKPQRARYVRFHVTKSNLGTPPGAFALDRLVVLSDVAETDGDVLCKPNEEGCACTIRPGNPLNLKAGRWILEGLTVVDETELWDGRPADVMYHWLSPDGRRYIQRRTVTNLALNGDLSLGALGPGIPVGFRPAAHFPMQQVKKERSPLREGESAENVVVLAPDEAAPEIALSARPVGIRAHESVLVAVRVAGVDAFVVRQDGGRERLMSTGEQDIFARLFTSARKTTISVLLRAHSRQQGAATGLLILPIEMPHSR